MNPVITSLLQERDADVRMQAVVLLQEDFSGNPRAREALAVVVSEDSRPLVRALVTRALAGENAWKDYIVASLKDASRSDAERIEAFMYQVATPGQVPGSFRFSGQLSPELLDDVAIRALSRLLPVAARSPEIKPAMDSVLSMVGALKKPAVTSLFLEMLDQTAEPEFKYSIIRELSRRGSEPAVRAVLEKLSRADPDAKLRELATNALKGEIQG